ncbi:DMT family transporter [Marinitoga aeolica]|uniref:DMT family transporter n=1 Tax=Marinitoga aeolica TaxID=2809031 RepID=A0ABY8PQM7_9BACT|nr:DMT family transporter [Marinitoga aeolica]WGS64935.1 DMT family transporter [Marinitoga aeolica]
MKKSIIYILLASILMGSTFPIQKIGLLNVDPLTYIFLRFLIATFLSFLIFKKNDIFHSFILGLVLSVGYISQIIGIKYTTASKSGFIVSQYIIFIPIFSYIIEKEKITKYQSVGFLFSIIGSYLLSGGISGFNFGDLLMFICAISFALHIVLITKFSKIVDEKHLLSFQFLTVTVISFIALLIFKKSIYVTPVSFLTIFYTAIVGSIIVIYLQLKYQKNIGSNLTAILFLSQPIFSALLSFILLKESFTFKQIIGSSILLFGIIISNFSNKKN